MRRDLALYHLLKSARVRLLLALVPIHLIQTTNAIRLEKDGLDTKRKQNGVCLFPTASFVDPKMEISVGFTPCLLIFDYKN